jgi:hypothetical protein
MNRLSEGAIELNDNEVFNNCSYSCYANIADALNILKTYENTGLEPEEIKQAYDMYLEVYSKVSEYADLMRQGLLINLPCKVGDIFYINIQKKTYECKISGFYINKDEIEFMVAFPDEDNKTWYETGETHRQEELFLTREEAEKVLKK